MTAESTTAGLPIDAGLLVSERSAAAEATRGVGAAQAADAAGGGGRAQVIKSVKQGRFLALGVATSLPDDEDWATETGNPNGFGRRKCLNRYRSSNQFVA